MKKCSICQENKELTEFYSAKYGKFGVGSWCKFCTSQKSKKKSLKIKENLKDKTIDNNIIKYCMKICSKCGIEKGENEFYLSRNGRYKDGRCGVCKICRKEYYNKWYKDNKEQRADYRKKWSENNKERDLAYRKKYREDNIDLIRYRKKDYYRNNRGKELRRMQEWQKSNKDYFKKYREDNRKKTQNREKDRYKYDKVYNVRRRVSCAVRIVLKKQNLIKDSATWLKLPYTPQQLKEHLEKQFDENMSWANYGLYWNIDHITPQSLLLYDSLDHPNFLKCWDLSNLRPLEKIQNIKKGNKLTYEPKT